jgi:hypothetical protein
LGTSILMMDFGILMVFGNDTNILTCFFFVFANHVLITN